VVRFCIRNVLNFILNRRRTKFEESITSNVMRHCQNLIDFTVFHMILTNTSPSFLGTALSGRSLRLFSVSRNRILIYNLDGCHIHLTQCPGRGSWWTASKHRGPGSMPGQSSEKFGEKITLGQYIFVYSGFRPSVSFRQHTVTHTNLKAILIRRTRAAKAGDFHKKQRFFIWWRI